MQLVNIKWPPASHGAGGCCSSFGSASQFFVKDHQLQDQQNEEQAISDAEAKKASGKQKLKDLGLTDLEIEALFKPEQGSIE